MNRIENVKVDRVAYHKDKLIKVNYEVYEERVIHAIEFNTRFPFIHTYPERVEKQLKSIIYVIPGELGHFTYNGKVNIDQLHDKYAQASILMDQFSILKETMW